MKLNNGSKEIQHKIRLDIGSLLRNYFIRLHYGRVEKTTFGWEKLWIIFNPTYRPEDELLAALSSITIDSSDEELPAERHWQSGRFTPVLPEFRGEPGIRNTILVGRKTPFDYFQLFFDENMMQHIVDETNRYYSQNPAGERQHMSNWHDVTSMEIHTFLAITMLTGTN